MASGEYVESVIDYGSIRITDELIKAAISAKSKCASNRNDMRSLNNIMKIFSEISKGNSNIKTNPIKPKVDDKIDPKFLLLKDGRVSFQFRRVDNEWVFVQCDVP